MYAIMETGGKQYKVQKGDVLSIEKLNAETGGFFEVSKILALSRDDGLIIGKPYVEGAKVVLKIIEQGKGEKILVFKYKPKKKYRKLRGHRQPYSKVMVDGIFDGSEIPEAEEAKTPDETQAAEEIQAAEEDQAIEEIQAQDEVQSPDEIESTDEILD